MNTPFGGVQSATVRLSPTFACQYMAALYTSTMAREYGTVPSIVLAAVGALSGAVMLFRVSTDESLTFSK